MTIHPKNNAAVRITQHYKFEPKGTVVDPVVGEVHLYEANKRIILSPPGDVGLIVASSTRNVVTYRWAGNRISISSF